MKKKLTLTINDDVYDRLKMLPRGISVSQFVNDMLKEMIKEFGIARSPDEMEELEESQYTPPLTVEDWLRDAWLGGADMVGERKAREGKKKEKGRKQVK